MSQVYSTIKKELEAFIKRVYPGLAQIPLDADSGHGEFTSPLGYLQSMDAETCAETLTSENQTQPPLFMGKRLIQSITPSSGHVCFHITAEAYSLALAHIIKKYPLPQMPEDTSGAVDYAIARMLMLCRGKESGCPHNPKVKNAVWLALGIEGTKGKKREAMRRRAAEALCEMFDGLSLSEYNFIRANCASVGDACARLLSLEKTEN